jgi:hypothetical protein
MESKMEKKPELHKMSFEFVQDAHCLSTSVDETEILTIECMSDLGIDYNGGFFMVLKTEQWSIDSIDDLKKLVDRIQKVLLNSKTPPGENCQEA